MVTPNNPNGEKFRALHWALGDNSPGTSYSPAVSLASGVNLKDISWPKWSLPVTLMTVGPGWSYSERRAGNLKDKCGSRSPNPSLDQCRWKVIRKWESCLVSLENDKFSFPSRKQVAAVLSFHATELQRLCFFFFYFFNFHLREKQNKRKRLALFRISLN